MSEEKDLAQPSFELQQLIDSIMEAEPETVVVNGKKRRIGWLHNCVTRKFTHVMMTEQDPWRRTVKVAACVLLNHRHGFMTMLLLKFWYWIYWRWLFYVTDIDQADIVGILAATKKKTQSGPLAVATILATGAMDTMMTMSRQDFGRAARSGEEPTR